MEILINYWYGGLTASDGARLHQKRLIIGSSSSGAAASGDWADNTLGSVWLQWRWCGGVGTCVDINYNKRRCNDSADHHCAGTSRLFVANLPTAPNQQYFGPGATSVGEKALRSRGLKHMKSHLKMLYLLKTSE